MIGDRYFGLRGALAALAGMLTSSADPGAGPAVVYAQFASHPAVAGALRGMGAVAAGLIAGWASSCLCRSKPPLAARCVAFAGLTIVAMARLRWPLSGSCR